MKKKKKHTKTPKQTKTKHHMWFLDPSTFRGVQNLIPKAYIQMHLNSDDLATWKRGLINRQVQSWVAEMHQSSWAESVRLSPDFQGLSFRPWISLRFPSLMLSRYTKINDKKCLKIPILCHIHTKGTKHKTHTEADGKRTESELWSSCPKYRSVNNADD